MSQSKCSHGECPSAHDLGDGNILIVGRNATLEELEKSEARIGDGEWAVVVPRETLEKVE